MTDPGNPGKLIEDSIKYLLPLPLTQTSRDQLKKRYTSGWSGE